MIFDFYKGTDLTNSQNDARTFVKPKPDLTRRRTKDKNSTKTIRKADKEIPSDTTQVIEKGNKTKTIRKGSADETKVSQIFLKTINLGENIELINIFRSYKNQVKKEENASPEVLSRLKIHQNHFNCQQVMDQCLLWNPVLVKINLLFGMKLFNQFNLLFNFHPVQKEKHHRSLHRKRRKVKSRRNLHRTKNLKTKSKRNLIKNHQLKIKENLN